MKRTLRLLALAASLSLTAAPAYAGQNRLVGSVGVFNVLHRHQNATDFRLDYRWGEPWAFGIKPFIGAEATTKGSLYGAGGLYADIAMAPHIYLTPSFGVGYYAHGEGKHLGTPLEFRSQIESSYEFDNTQRIGLFFSHTSNADLGSPNPGVETLGLNYGIPF